MSNTVNLSGYHLSFDAEMTSAADLSLFTNTFVNGDVTIPSNNEAETYVPAATNPGTYSFANGALTINATPSGSGNYTSGMLSTAQSFVQNQGYFEIRAKLAPGAGFWSAFWLSSSDYNTEVDILEQPNNNGAQNYFTSVKAGALNAGSFLNTGVDLSAAYHTYGFMWTATTVQFVFDGNYIGYAAPTPAALATMKMFLYTNLAVGGYGSWPRQPSAGASSSLSIDYIRAYSNDPSVPTWSGTEQATSPDTGTTVPGTTPSSSTAPVTVPQAAISIATVSTPVYRFFDSTTGTQFLTSSAAERDTVVNTRPDLVNEGVGLQAVSPAANDVSATPIYRFFDSVYGTHFYTSNMAERDTILSTRADLNYEGVGFYDYPTLQFGTSPVYRFFETSNGTHFYTASESERATILQTRTDLVAEGIAFYAPNSPTAA